MQTDVFDKQYYVHVYDTGPDGRISPWTLFNYMQDAAAEHAEKLGFGRDDLLRNNNFWVLSRIYAEIYSWPAWGDRITLRTWPNGTDKLFAMRNYEINSFDGIRLAAASSSWLVVDRSTKRVQRPEITIEQFKTPYSENHSDVRCAGKLKPLPEGSAKTLPGKVKTSDLDVNLHTNNVNYLKWVCDTYDLDFVMSHRLFSAEINYLAESVFGDDVHVGTMRSADGMIFDHTVARHPDNKELCRLRLCWEKR